MRAGHNYGSQLGDEMTARSIVHMFELLSEVHIVDVWFSEPVSENNDPPHGESQYRWLVPISMAIISG